MVALVSLWLHTARGWAPPVSLMQIGPAACSTQPAPGLCQHQRWLATSPRVGELLAWLRSGADLWAAASVWRLWLGGGEMLRRCDSFLIVSGWNSGRQKSCGSMKLLNKERTRREQPARGLGEWVNVYNFKNYTKVSTWSHLLGGNYCSLYQSIQTLQ